MCGESSDFGRIGMGIHRRFGRTDNFELTRHSIVRKLVTLERLTSPSGHQRCGYQMATPGGFFHAMSNSYLLAFFRANSFALHKVTIGFGDWIVRSPVDWLRQFFEPGDMLRTVYVGLFDRDNDPCLNTGGVS